MKEWRDIKNYPGYSVSSIGEVVSRRQNHPRVLKQNPDKDGYLRVVLYNQNGSKEFRVRALICAIWHGESPGMMALHNNGQNTDNRPDNIRWGTLKENSKDSHKHGVYIKGEAVNTAKLRAIDIVAIRMGTKNNSATARDYGVTPANIRQIRTRRTWKHVA